MEFWHLSWIFLLQTAVSWPAGVYIGKDGTVGASWGGYSASAGLGGLVGGGNTRGGLHAQAGTPDGHYAAAGLGGSVSERSGAQGQLYSAAGQAKPVIIAQPVAPVDVVPAPPPLPLAINGDSSSAATSSASAQSGSGVNRQPQGTIFDDIFNIPISTLGAVGQYLNSRKTGAPPQPAQPNSNSVGYSADPSSPLSIPISVLQSVNRFLNGKK